MEAGDNQPLARPVGFRYRFVLPLQQPLHLSVLLGHKRPGRPGKFGCEVKLLSEVHGGRG